MSELNSARPHIPVMLNEVLQTLSPQDNETYIDGTFGAGGYSSALLDKANCTVIALDRDPDVLPTAKRLKDIYKTRFHFIQGCFGDMDKLISESDHKNVDGVVLDIGVSSMQIDQAERGFSFRFDGPLDMRMSQTGRDAKAFINTALEEDIADVLYNFGDERLSRKIAKTIVKKRQEKEIETTTELAELVRSVYPSSYREKIDPATRTFQALRIYVNDELGELERGLCAAERVLKKGGRLVVVSFHSLEDSIVKKFLKERTSVKKSTNKYRPNDEPDSHATFEYISRKALQASKEELQSNSRARSAKLRAAIRTSTPLQREVA